MVLVNNLDLDKILVTSFCTNERTSQFNEHCIKKLNFPNSLMINNEKGFKEKYIDFAKKGLDTSCEYFVRIDGDHFIFDGIFDLLNVAINEEYDWLTGVVHDYVMNNYRGGTPQVLTRKVLELLVNDNDLMPNHQKPESEYSNNIRHLTKMGDVKILTALHEYEQYPSKICNSFLNRLHRNHLGLYNPEYLNSLPDSYKKAISYAFDVYGKNANKVSMDFEDFSFLDKTFEPLLPESIDGLYNHYQDVYNRVSTNFS